MDIQIKRIYDAPDATDGFLSLIHIYLQGKAARIKEKR